MNLTRNQITFLKYDSSNINVDKTTGWRHHYFDESIHELSTFIKLIGDDKIYLLIPLFAGSKSLKNATLNLSEPFLVDNKSNPELIIKFILEQWLSSSDSIKGKEVFTSPSFEDLNAKATESWAEGATSPKSDSSEVTIKASSKKVILFILIIKY